MKHITKILLLVLIIIGLSLTFICLKEDKTVEKTAIISTKNEVKKVSKKIELEEVTVAQWGQEKYLIYLPFYIAQEKGFFKDEGLKVNIKYSGNDDQVFATVLRGDAKFGIGDPIFTAVSREKGAKGKVVASIVNGVALWGVSKKDSNISEIKNIEGFKDLRIGTFPKPSTAYTLVKNTIQENSNILNKTKIVEAGLSSQIALLESDNSDIAIQLEPGVSIAESNGYKISLSFPELYGDFSFTGLSTIEKITNGEPDLVQKMVNAIERANVYSHSNTSGAIDVAHGLFKDIDKKIIENAVNRMIKANTIPKHAFTSVEGWEKAIKIRVQVGDLKSDKGSKDSLDNSFAIKAQK